MELPYKNLQITKKCRYSITINNPLTIPKYRVHLKKNKSENLEEWRTCFSSWYNFIVSDTWTTCLPVYCKGSLISKMLPTWKIEMSTDLITELCYSYMLLFFFIIICLDQLWATWIHYQLLIFPVLTGVPFFHLNVFIILEWIFPQSFF